MGRDVTEDSLERMTPFARALQEWAWEQRPPLATHTKLAARLHLPASTVSVWFSPTRPTVPRGGSYHAVKRATGWPTERMLELTGLSQEPADDMTPWAYARERMGEHRYFGGEPRTLDRILMALEEIERDYQRRARPSRQRRKPVVTPAETPERVTPLRRDREKVGSGGK